MHSWSKPFVYWCFQVVIKMDIQTGEFSQWFYTSPNWESRHQTCEEGGMPQWTWVSERVAVWYFQMGLSRNYIQLAKQDRWRDVDHIPQSFGTCVEWPEDCHWSLVILLRKLCGLRGPVGWQKLGAGLPNTGYQKINRRAHENWHIFLRLVACESIISKEDQLY